MAEFDKAFAITMMNEGGYNPGIGESETYRGIDRSMNSGWHGWGIIDAIKQTKPKNMSMNDALYRVKELQEDIELFYRRFYWNNLLLYKLNNQQVANQVFDCSVNPCIETASIVFQRSINKCGHKIVIDGIIGKITIDTANKINREGKSVELFNEIKEIRIGNYEARARRNTEMKRWLNGWIKRTGEYNAKSIYI